MTEWGWVTDDELTRIVVVSPHPDDAVLSCGQFLAAHPGVTVVTVFAGAPASYPDPPSWWSTLCGFTAGDDVTEARRAEDTDALGLLGATATWLDFLESQFTPDGSLPTSREIADVLDPALRALDPTLVLLPFGLANPEHVSTHDAVLEVRRRWSDDNVGSARRPPRGSRTRTSRTSRYPACSRGAWRRSSKRLCGPPRRRCRSTPPPLESARRWRATSRR